MINIILSDISTSVSELKKNPIPAELYEQKLDALDDQELIRLVNERREQALVDVDLDN
ncbi:hypothetical protein [Photorhabdus hindustanensis]|uniref:hypothetical protein n=1 Tax=Photorhabdus hindustanensis TaxID=2918802 RepID=UPI0015E453C5|nr:hypothetical protein [Photorhabdus hindustanensis]